MIEQEVKEVDHECVTGSVGVDDLLLRCSEHKQERPREQDQNKRAQAREIRQVC